MVVDVLLALRAKYLDDEGEGGRNGRSVVQIPFARQSSRQLVGDNRKVAQDDAQDGAQGASEGSRIALSPCWGHL